MLRFHTKKTLGKCPEEVVSMMVHIGADMGQMRNPIWILRSLLTNIHIRRGLCITQGIKKTSQELAWQPTKRSQSLTPCLEIVRQRQATLDIRAKLASIRHHGSRRD
jgi:hypothetical protein